ncbi:MAG TPA: hypothetical protein VKD90_04650 [Gemmataceae bacterium]|nr:hypothetical protein [Gemmataceae bacterium]
MTHSRRDFMADVGRGMIAAGLGTGLAAELGLCPALAADEPKELSFGALEPLVALLQETPKGKLLPILVDQLNTGTDLKRLTAAAAFANARTFGGENYFGFHTFMALAPAYQMANEMPRPEQALPLLKVLYRNAHYTQEVGGRKAEVLKPMGPVDSASPEDVHKAVNAGDRVAAERALAAVGRVSPEDALDAALLGVEDNHDVHTVVMPWRAYAMLDIVGRDHAVTLLRQSVRQTAKQCESMKGREAQLAAQRKTVPGLLEKHKLPKDGRGTRAADDAWVENLCATIQLGSQEQAGEAVAVALAEGFAPEHIGEAISLAANALVLRQVEKWEGRGNTLTQRTHGDSPGVHASDATNAWRNIVRVSNPRNRAAGLMLAAMDAARSHSFTQGNKSPAYVKEPYPHAADLEKITAKSPESLLKELDGSIRENDQLRAMAVAQRYGELGGQSRPVFDLLLRYAVSEDGRLHSEKYYRTVTEEFSTTRPAFRWRQIVALARVTASMYGYSQQDKKEGRAPGYEEARKLLKLA